MEKTITLTMTESEAKSFEKLLDEFNSTMKRITDAGARSDENKHKFDRTETQVLLAQAKDELKKIRAIKSSREKMIWER